MLTSLDSSVRELVERTLEQERLLVTVAHEAAYMTTAVEQESRRQQRPRLTAENAENAERILLSACFAFSAVSRGHVCNLLSDRAVRISRDNVHV